MLMVVPLPWDATSYYRGYGVIPDLREKMGGDLYAEHYQGKRYTWAELHSFDILFLQRPGNPENLKLIKYCKDLGIKVWIDHDDNLFELPPYNRVSDEYTPEVKRTMWEMLRLADVVTVSTQGLRDFFATNGVVAEVVPNALNEKLTPMATKYNKPGAITNYVWRGSDTHEADTYFFGEEIYTAINSTEKRLWHFVGYNPWKITINVEQRLVNYIKPEDIFIYFGKLRALKGQVMHVPLVKDRLNDCKSNIAWIEATAAGMVTIAPDWPEWRKPGVTLYNDILDYGFKLIAEIETPEQKWKESRDYILENLTLAKVNERRSAIVRRLTDKPKTYGMNLPETMIE